MLLLFEELSVGDSKAFPTVIVFGVLGYTVAVAIMELLLLFGVLLVLLTIIGLTPAPPVDPLLLASAVFVDLERDFVDFFVGLLWPDLEDSSVELEFEFVFILLF